MEHGRHDDEFEVLIVLTIDDSDTKSIIGLKKLRGWLRCDTKSIRPKLRSDTYR